MATSTPASLPALAGHKRVLSDAPGPATKKPEIIEIPDSSPPASEAPEPQFVFVATELNDEDDHGYTHTCLDAFEDVHDANNFIRDRANQYSSMSRWYERSNDAGCISLISSKKYNNGRMKFKVYELLVKPAGSVPKTRVRRETRVGLMYWQR